MEYQVLWHELLAPTILGKVILEDELRVVGVAKVVALGDGLDLVVEELEGVLVGELDHVVLQGANALEQLR